MQKRILLLAIGAALGALALAAAFSGSSSLQAAGEPRLITVTGDADVKVAPDEIVLILGVETSDKNLATAKNQNDERVKRILAFVQRAGIESKNIQTEQIRVEPRYRDGYTQTDFVGFFVRKTIVITLKDVAKFEDIYTGVLESGATHVQGIQFRTTELRKYRDQARALAIQAAQEKANAMAKTLGQKAGKPYSIREDYSNWWSWYDRWWGGGMMSQNVTQNVSGGATSDEGTFAPGQITVNARVTVSFELE